MKLYFIYNIKSNKFISSPTYGSWSQGFPHVWKNVSAVKSAITILSRFKGKDMFKDAQILSLSLDKTLLEKTDLNMSVEDFKEYKE